MNFWKIFFSFVDIPEVSWVVLAFISLIGYSGLVVLMEYQILWVIILVEEQQWYYLTDRWVG